MAFPYPYTGPIALGNNYPINAQYYQPSQFFVANITLGATTTVTTTVNHNYVIAQQCRLIIPPSNGCIQLNESQGTVIQIPSPTQVVLSIDSSRNVDQFQTSTANTQPQILAIGDFNQGATNSQGRSNTSTFVPGSFINISPE
jgi:hypothetical protein